MNGRTRRRHKFPSSEAQRKRKARAEGRVTPRMPRPKRTIASWIQSTEKGIATRQALLARLESEWDGLRDSKEGNEKFWAIERCKSGIRRAGKVLATYQRRAAKEIGLPGEGPQ